MLASGVSADERFICYNVEKQEEIYDFCLDDKGYYIRADLLSDKEIKVKAIRVNTDLGIFIPLFWSKPLVRKYKGKTTTIVAFDIPEAFVKELPESLFFEIELITSDGTKKISFTEEQLQSVKILAIID